MISVEEASKTILMNFRKLGREKVAIIDALARVAGEDVYAAYDIPGAANSAMDGYAVRHRDTAGANRRNPVSLKIVEHIPAGHVPQKKIRRGEAARIMTGGLIPAGADAVIRQEDTKAAGTDVLVIAEIAAGKDIRFAGEDVQNGSLVISQGTFIKPAVIGMLAALGRTQISVYRRPRVAIIATGDELVAVTRKPPAGKIINSNSYALSAQVLACGGMPLMLGIARDRKKDLQRLFKSATASADLIISSGGVSVGDFDFVKTVMKEGGNSLHFWRVAMKPGKPLAFGEIEGVPVLGLPGNPVSTMVSFEQFVRPCLLKMQGHENLFRPLIKAVLMEEIRKKAGARHFIRAIVKKEKNKYFVSSTGGQGSGILSSMVLANALIVLAENATKVKKGSLVDVQLLAD
ncbi:MAG TPA: molybdopterin molybdotransferase MoeA [Smithellaceae bacterium]|nr:molybdopterin molybdotransferase MoeA [Smithellaceae bacterium]